MYYCTTYKNASEEHLWRLLVVVERRSLLNCGIILSVNYSGNGCTIITTMIHNGDDRPPAQIV